MAESEGGGGVVRELLAVFGFGVETDELKHGETQLHEFLEKVKGAVEAIGAIFAINEIKEWAEANVQAMRNVELASERLGISTDRVQEFQFAAKSLGLDTDALVNSLGRLQVSANAASQGNAQASRAFADLGVHVKDANGNLKSADELMLDAADGFQKIEDPSKRAALATQLFGRSGRNLLPFLIEGRKGFEEYAEAYKELGGGWTEKALEANKRFEKQEARTALATTGLKSTIMVQLLPILEGIAKTTEKVVSWLRQMVEHSNIVQAALVVFGAVATAFAIKMAIAFAPILLVAAALAAIVLIVDDLITMFKGGESVIGDAIDAVFGKGAHTEVIQTVAKLWGDIADAFKTIAEYSGQVGDWLGKQNVKAQTAQYEFGGGKELYARSTLARQRLDASKSGQLFIAPGETVAQARAALGEVQQMNPQLVPFGPSLPAGGAGASSGGGNTTNVTGNQFHTHVHEAHDPHRTANEVKKQQKQMIREAVATHERAPAASQ